MLDLSNWLLVSDIDGTLVDREFKCNPKNIEKINEFISYGGKFGIATGRALKSAVNAASIINTSCPSLVFNGGAICDLKTEEYFWKSTIHPSGYDCCKFIYENFPKASIEIHIGSKIYVARESARGKVHISQACTEIVYTDFYCIPKENWSKVLFAAEFDEIDELIELIQPFIDDRCNYIRTNKQYYEILPKEADKGRALIQLAQMLNIPIQNVCAIGDYLNDITLLESATHSACPQESPDEVKSRSNYICCKCSDGAVADFIDHIFNMVK